MYLHMYIHAVQPFHPSIHHSPFTIHHSTIQPFLHLLSSYTRQKLARSAISSPKRPSEAAASAPSLTGKNSCQKCRITLKPAANFCLACGTKQTTTRAASVSITASPVKAAKAQRYSSSTLLNRETP